MLRFFRIQYARFFHYNRKFSVILVKLSNTWKSPKSCFHAPGLKSVSSKFKLHCTQALRVQPSGTLKPFYLTHSKYVGPQTCKIKIPEHYDYEYILFSNFYISMQYKSPIIEL